MRKAILKFVFYKILRLPENEYLPKKYSWIVRIFYPIIWEATYRSPIKYDFITGMIEIYGVRYSSELFKAWSNVGVPLNTKFILVKRENGAITLERV